jgi:enoyl-[acyl-carrier protein] reductase I
MGVAKAALEASVKYLAMDLGDAGIRVNAISSGPMRTLSGAAIGAGRTIYHWARNNSALGRDLNRNDVADASLYLLSDLSRGVTGEIHYVDNGNSIIGISPLQDSGKAEAP